MKICEKCGSVMNDDVLFCSRCGKKYKDTSIQEKPKKIKGIFLIILILIIILFTWMVKSGTLKEASLILYNILDTDENDNFSFLGKNVDEVVKTIELAGYEATVMPRGSYDFVAFKMMEVEIEDWSETILLSPNEKSDAKYGESCILVAFNNYIVAYTGIVADLPNIVSVMKNLELKSLIGKKEPQVHDSGDKTFYTWEVGKNVFKVLGFVNKNYPDNWKKAFPFQYCVFQKNIDKKQLENNSAIKGKSTISDVQWRTFDSNDMEVFLVESVFQEKVNSEQHSDGYSFIVGGTCKLDGIDCFFIQAGTPDSMNEYYIVDYSSDIYGGYWHPKVYSAGWGGLDEEMLELCYTTKIFIP